MTPRSYDPDTLKGYDMVISVSQDAINKQFQRLYETEIPNALMPDPEKLEDFVEAFPAAKHYINHQVKIKPGSWEEWDAPGFEGIRPEVRPENGMFLLESDKWVEGEIEAPFVTFGEGDDSLDFRCVRVNLKFKSGKFHYTMSGRLLESDLAGCTLSWLTDLAHEEVGNAMREIVAASGDRKSHTLVAKPVLDKLEEVSEQKFTVTALFCALQSINTLKLMNFKGGSQTVAAREAGTVLSSYLKALGNRCRTVSTPNNPFVLGYGLTQEIAAQTGEQKARAANVPYLVPRRFDLSVTKGDGHYSKGVLNYCILTRRPEGVAESDINLEADSLAGRWEDGDTPFKRVRADGMSSGADGVMALSRHVFRDFWLKDQFLGYFKVNTAELAKTLVPGDDSVARAPGLSNDTESFTTNGPNTLTLKQDFAFHDMACQEMDAQRMLETEELGPVLKAVLNALASLKGVDLKYDQKRLAKGVAEAILTYTSDVQQNPVIDKADEQRRLKFDIELKSLVTITQQASGICNVNRLAPDFEKTPILLIASKVVSNLRNYQRIISEWRDARRADVQITTRAGFDMAPASNTWKLDLVKAKPRTTIPLGSDELPRQVIGPQEYSTFENITGITKLRKLDERSTEDGVVIELSNHDMFKEFGTAKGMDRFAEPAKQWASDFESRLEANMAALATSLQTKLILPAGNVFEFKSLNTDSEGHVYTLITYKDTDKLSQTTPGDM